MSEEADLLGELAGMLFFHPEYNTATLRGFVMSARENRELVGGLIKGMQGGIAGTQIREQNAVEYRRVKRELGPTFFMPMDVEAVAAYYGLEEQQQLLNTLPPKDRRLILQDAGFTLLPKPPGTYPLWDEEKLFQCEDPKLRAAILENGIANGRSAWLALHSSVIPEFSGRAAELQLFSVDGFARKRRVKVMIATPSYILWAHHLSRASGMSMFQRGAFRVRNPGISAQDGFKAHNITIKVDFDVPGPPMVCACDAEESSTSLTLGLMAHLV